MVYFEHRHVLPYHVTSFALATASSGTRLNQLNHLRGNDAPAGRSATKLGLHGAAELRVLGGHMHATALIQLVKQYKPTVGHMSPQKATAKTTCIHIIAAAKVRRDNGSIIIGDACESRQQTYVQSHLQHSTTWRFQVAAISLQYRFALTNLCRSGPYWR